MQFTQQQIEELLTIITKNQLVTIGQELGPEFLTSTDRQLLSDHGIDFETLYRPELDSIFTSFSFGMLSEALQAKVVNAFSYDELYAYIKSGNYIPLTVGEFAALNSIKAQTFNDLKSLNGRIFKDVNQIGLNTIPDQKTFLADETRKGLLSKQTSKQIANEIATKTGDWSRDFDRIITYANTYAFETGKAATIIQHSGESDPFVYKKVFPGACKHCIRLYLTNGLGSQPKIFRLSELINNGTNIGRKIEDWLPVLGPIHPYCRCQLFYLLPRYVWNDKTKTFAVDTNNKPTIVGTGKKRKLIRVTIGGQEYQV